ncbi:C40 family peptidase [Heliophilum fasciatum]|uniref:Cell wall-associated NlpC family hydrolase n=1 Tax=Heliophilum fasciatum TaxID=35700 RepID=A0A4R2RLB1_9FIRM|nr:C40 family peptidase [Heliophilum fasciatum]MCW2278290.1 peptidoglycan endopeptidase LytE [Heliophilum fasciatum]TCP63913.1 cell wall-associated NlpC family hydrolase [Heliophilum fasciatum]
MKTKKRSVAIATLLSFLLLTGTAQAATTSYTVSPGDSIWSIGQKFKVTEKQIMEANPFTSTTLYPGQTIKIPIFTYTVRTGDTLYKIGQAYGYSVTELTQVNPQINNVANLQPGQVINLPTYPPKISPVATSTTTSSPKADAIVATAKRFLGTPYLYGAAPGQSNNFDCSSFTATVFGANGISLPRIASDQAQKGTFVPTGQLKKGDLLCFANSSTINLSGYPRVGHVGIYIDNNQFIHASSGAGYVTTSTLSNPYYSQMFLYAKRLF